MGQQQLLLLILGAIIIGMAIYMGILMFATNNAASNKDAIISDLIELGSDAYGFIYRPVTMGGGGGSYAGYTISAKSPWGPSNVNATYTITSQTASRIDFLATSKVVAGASISEAFDNSGKNISGPVMAGF